MAVSHALVLLVILLALGGSVLLLLSRNLYRSATNDLRSAAESQAEAIRESDRVGPPADSDVPSAASVQVAVYAAPDARLVGEPTEVPTWLKRYPDEVTDLVVAGEPVRVITLPVAIQGRTVAWIAAGRSLEPEDLLLERVRLALLVGGALAVLASLAAGWWLAGRAVEPVERAYEAQAGFAADASHELRTPLTFIRSGVEVLAERDPELGEEVLAEIDYLTGLTQRLLLLARAERGEVTLDVDRLDVADACRSAARRSEAAHGNRLTLTGPAPLLVEGDRVGLEAALDAVLENVRTHGGGVGEVRWVESGGEATISVIDHGPGMPDDHLDRAFDRFFRADPSRARDTGGAGLGLALARTLVEAQGGRMWIEATPGGGLTAEIALRAPRID